MRAAILFLCLVLALSGCKKKEEAIVAAQPVSADTSAVVSASAQPAMEVQSQAGDPSALLAELTQAVRRFGLEQQRVPKSLEELVGKGYLARVPEAPPGKKFTINSKLEVVLANR